MPTSTDKHDLLRKIQGLLAKAESSEFEAERDSFFTAANNMMNKYRIELWEIQQHAAGMVIDQRKPVIQDFDYNFAFESGPFPEICDGLWSLFLSTARHTNCVVVTHMQHYSNADKTYKGGTVPIIGTEADLGYMTLLFTSLMTQLISATHPTPDKSASLFDNLRKFREAGWGWDDVGKVMQQAGFDADMARTAARDKYIRYYRSECKKRGVEQNYANWKTFRRNFAQGFASTISLRFSEMRRATPGSSTTGMELALRDQDKINREFMLEEFPLTGGMRGGSSKAVSRKHDDAAQSAGRSAGARANITGNPGSGLKGRKSISK